MPAGHHPHGTTAYAPPVTVRAPSPASSIGTLYDEDATSDNEAHMTESDFKRFCDDKIGLNKPRPEEERALREPLIKDPARGRGGEQEQALYERIVANLRAEIKRLEEEEIFEQEQAPTTDIDKIMRSMMGPGFSLTPPGQPSTSSTGTQPTQPAVTLGPWNNHGKPVSLKSGPFPSNRPRPNDCLRKS
ncbi:hypothetical protein FA13DRAFT_1808416 [Coprinellus micaceus]|uniref:Uncharacterized protein n=1 Tax=Coprinellus micaceus TaxID=71717 RepID=A0A4Y7U148_COPMI|nr:hypothetical protein FA13DRAFT_1808416 [Coprinellus micaceus]